MLKENGDLVNRTLITTITLLILLAITVLAHENTPSKHIADYDIAFISESKAYVNQNTPFTVQIQNLDGNTLTNLEVQGQIVDEQTRKEIFYAKATEKKPGEYTFSWKPSFAGKYLVQFLFRQNNEAIQPQFPIQVNDIRSTYAWIITISGAIIVLLIGLFMSLPKKKRKFHASPLLVGIVAAVVLLGIGYSVSYFYQAGGEKGFVICGKQGCDLSVHWHSDLHFNLCDTDFSLPLEAGDLNKQHTHKERNKLHFHALIKTNEAGTELLEPEKLRLGELFDHLGIRFTDTCFGDYCNKDLCNEKTGQLTMTVNDLSNNKFADYIWKDGDEIKIGFG